MESFKARVFTKVCQKNKQLNKGCEKIDENFREIFPP
jgi:hypothetical protein